MSARNSYTTSDYLNWDTAINLVHKLYRDGDYRISLFVAAGIMLGLRVSDIKRLTWRMLLENDVLVIVEKKTKKRREIKLNKHFKSHVKDCFTALSISNIDEACFLSNKKVVFSTQRLNVILKELKAKYNIKVERFSCHSLRKTFGRQIFNAAGDNKEMALVKLSQVFGHSSTAITRRYLGLREEEILATYDLLDF